MTIQAFRRHSAAVTHANGGAILTINKFGERLYVAIPGEPIEVRMTGIELTAQDGKQAGFITLDHFDRLGNACHAEADPCWSLPGKLIRNAPETADVD